MAKKKNIFTVEDVMLAVFTGAESVHGFSAFEPSVFTIQHLAVPQQQVASIRKGYAPAVGLSLIIGGAVSAIRKNPLPLLFAGGASGFMIIIYEWAIRTAPITLAQRA